MAPGRERRDRLRDYEALGVDRIMLQGFAAVTEPGLLEAIADDAAAVGFLGSEA